MPNLLQAFGITEATDKLCGLAGLPPNDWDQMTDEQLDEMIDFYSRITHATNTTPLYEQPTS